VVDGVAVAVVLPQFLSVVERRDEMFDACPDPAVRPVVVIADGPPGGVAQGVMLGMPR
jgi:hypothetical protein